MTVCRLNERKHPACVGCYRGTGLFSLTQKRRKPGPGLGPNCWEETAIAAHHPESKDRFQDGTHGRGFRIWGPVKVRTGSLGSRGGGVKVGEYNTGTYGRKGFILPLHLGGLLCQGKGRTPQFPPLAVGCPFLSSFFSRKPTWTAPALPYDDRPKGQGEGPAYSQAEGRGPRSMSVINAE